MFERKISEYEVRQALSDGVTIEQYPDDTPYPSRLVLGNADKRALHIVVADSKIVGETVIISVYEPDETKWEKDFRRRKK